MSALETALADAAKFASLAEPLIAFAMVAQKATGLGGVIAAEALATIEAALKALEQAAVGKITAAHAKDQMDALKATLDAHAAAAAKTIDQAEADLDARFPAGGV